MKSLNSTDAEERKTTLKTLAGPADSSGQNDASGQAEVFVRSLFQAAKHFSTSLYN